MTPIDFTPPTPHEARRIAVEACVCERTVRRFFAGELIRSTCRARIEQALRALAAADRSSSPEAPGRSPPP